MAGQQKASVDWINATFPGPDRYTPGEFLALLTRIFRRPITGTAGRGLFGFDQGIKLHAAVGSRVFPIGFLAYGGESQRGRWMLQLTGAGCGVVSSWSRLRKLLQALGAKLTRLDLAVDFLEGEYTVDHAVSLYKAGDFTSNGRPPSSSLAGDWLGGTGGRTLYIGRAENGKLLRVYEKGKQLGNSESAWTRYEVQLGARDRVIPLDALIHRDAYLAGCYPALEKMLQCGAEHIKTSDKKGAVGLAHLMFHLRRSYGKLIDVLTGPLSADAAELVDEIRVIGAPRRLHPSALTGGLDWAQVAALHATH